MRHTLVILVCIAQVSSIEIVKSAHSLQCLDENNLVNPAVINAIWTKDDGTRLPEGNDTRIALRGHGSRLTFSSMLPSDEGVYVCTDPATGAKATYRLSGKLSDYRQCT